MKYLTVEQVAAFIGVCPETVRRMCRDGLLHYYRPNGSRRYRFKQADIESYMDAGSVKSIRELING